MRLFLYPILILIFIVEVFFQIIFIADIKNLKKPILYFNPYCDQPYWDLEGDSSYDKKKYTYHPILSIIKKENEELYNSKSIKKNELIFYGSSFIDHKYFVPNYENKINFAVQSYGFDQIYQSYILTKDNFPNSKIIIGFLLEDIDRAVFDKRNFTKLKYIFNKNNYEISNVPVSLNETSNFNLHFYTYRFIKSIIFLSLNEFNYKKSLCKVEEKKQLFKFFINEIISKSRILNQNIIFVTFNFMNDVNDSNWRYTFVKDYLKLNNINHIDMTNVIKNDIKKNNSKISDYYNKEDFHLNRYGFSLTKFKIDEFIKQYK